MGRLVRAARPAGATGTAGNNRESVQAGAAGAGEADGYADRMAKYIPGEIIAFYLAADRNLIPSREEYERQVQFLKSARVRETATAVVDNAWRLSLHEAMPLILLCIGLVFTPLYIWQLARRAEAGTPWRMQATVSTFAFLVWAYAIQGSAFVVGPLGGLYAGNVAATAVAFFTLATGMFQPAPARQATEHRQPDRTPATSPATSRGPERREPTASEPGASLAPNGGGYRL